MVCVWLLMGHCMVLLFLCIYKRELDSMRGHRLVLRVLKFDLVLHLEMEMYT